MSRLERIWKFPLLPSGEILMPAGARVLHVAAQGADVCAWAMVDPNAPSVWRRLRVCPTGGDDPGGTYVGTFQVGTFVGHVFDHGETAVAS